MMIFQTNTGRSRERQEFGPDLFGSAVEDCNAAFHAETGFAGVAGIEKQSRADSFAERLVRVAEDNHGGLFAIDTALERFVKCARIDDVMDQELAANKLNDFRLFEMKT